ncbi:hypothetical protein DCAR_0209514 [Daucus carota subsp. sativus]|uniref:GPI transamidase subunit PIG-U n=1 Tax=Daucus carota subsp. sativus TaxID=79200 RepID=A0AAF1AS20_DAUCS|nr:PREDICTED: phosphatidylinositol glycan anchor biosynthesis class U protein [Daucus carota subsp. sativus]WOG90271.1 hypothetical protein DCAR_0209514 [Daucus carota subsp. sativus]
MGLWQWTWASILLRLILIYFPHNVLNLSSRPELSTPLTSLRRLAEGYWLKQSSISPYAGSMYHGSPILLSLLGPLTVIRIEGLPAHILCSLVFVIADLASAMLIRAIGNILNVAYSRKLNTLKLGKLVDSPDFLPAGDIAALVYLWNPFTIVTCVGSSTSPIENFLILLTLYGACKRLPPLAAFGWVVSSHVALYPAILIIPVILLLGYGPDSPPRKLFFQRNPTRTVDDIPFEQSAHSSYFSWTSIVLFFFWVSVFASCVLFLCGLSVKEYGGLHEMIQRTYGFMLTVEDLSPNIGVLWYFFAEVFDFFRDFFLIVFHVNILFMLLPLAIRLNHRPCFLAFVYIAISSILKSYPSVGDSALYLGLLSLFVNELADMQFSFFLFSGYVGVSLLSPIMHNLWIWRGTGNANFYFATAMAYACFQIVLVVESVNAILNHDRKIRKLCTTTN